MSALNDHDLLIRLSERLEHLISRFDGHNESHRIRCEQLDMRLRVLERWRWQWLGAMALLVFLINWLSRVMTG